MNWNEAVEKLHSLIRDAHISVSLRKGAIVEIDGKAATPEQCEEIKEKGVEAVQGKVVEIFAMPHQSEAKPEIKKVDMHLLVIGVNEEVAKQQKNTFVEICRAYPQPERLKQGLSYIEVGGYIGSQEIAFHFFAIGEVLGLWKVITPKVLGVEGPQADEMAGMGLIMNSGFKEEAK